MTDAPSGRSLSNGSDCPVLLPKSQHIYHESGTSDNPIVLDTVTPDGTSNFVERGWAWLPLGPVPMSPGDELYMERFKAWKKDKDLWPFDFPPPRVGEEEGEDCLVDPRLGAQVDELIAWTRLR
jgi:hypothetical protein